MCSAPEQCLLIVALSSGEVWSNHHGEIVDAFAAPGYNPLFS